MTEKDCAYIQFKGFAGNVYLFLYIVQHVNQV